MKMKKLWNSYAPIILAVLSIVLFAGILLKNERQLLQSQSIFVALKPVDPRSLIQGDYMILNYELHFVGHEDEQKLTSQMEALKQRSQILAYIQLDDAKRVIATTLIPPATGVLSQKLLLKNPDQLWGSLYPSTRSFLFAEGLAECYEQAKYAEFKVNHDGKAILAGLRGDQLQDLQCEKQQSWSQGTVL